VNSNWIAQINETNMILRIGGDCDDIANWLIGRSERDIKLVNDLGRDYLATLVKNYGYTSY
jgi:hypothetical protein